MILYPAIDIRGGRCVRLVEGDFNRETAFDADPADAAARWAAAGAEWIHVVDLDGAVAGEPVNVDAIARIRKAVDDPDPARRRTAHRRAPRRRLRPRHQPRRARHRGDPHAGTRTSRRRPLGRCHRRRTRRPRRHARRQRLARTDRRAPRPTPPPTSSAKGVQHFIFTDIRRDGTLQGPNLDALAGIRNSLTTGRSSPPAASAHSIDLLAIAATGAAGAIVGRALYDGRVDLA